MNNWNILFVNDPKDDYNIMIELECNDKEMGHIKKINGKLEVVFYSSPNNITIPLDWLQYVLDESKNNL